MPRSATKQAPHFAATRMGRGFSGGLLCREARQWGLPLASPRFAQPIPKSRRRNRAGLVQRFPKQGGAALSRVKVFLTGASSGIGAALARQYAREGAQLG